MSELVFDSLLDVPLDTQEPDEDGDDRLVPGVQGIIHAPPSPALQVLMVPGIQTLVVPFKGPLKHRDRGKAVRALQRALSRAGYLKWTVFSGYFGERTIRALKAFQRDNWLQVDGVYGLKSHAKLARHYDAYSIRFLLSGTLDDVRRERLLAELMYLYNRRYSLPYTQRRPGDLRKPPWYGADCSFSLEWGCKWAGLPSPSGYSAFGYGNTDTQYARFRQKGWLRQSISEAKTGDPKYYGYGDDPSHVAMFIGRKDGISRVWSFGSFPIKILDHNYRHDGIKTCNLTGQ